MIRVGWDENGYPKWVSRGNESIEEACSIISSNVDPFRLIKLADGTVIERNERAIKIDKTEFVADGFDKATISGLPAPCELMINGVITKVPTTSYVLSTTVEGAILIKFCGKWIGEILVVAKAATLVETEVRLERDRRLTASDWTQVLDVELSTQKKGEWLAYRKLLRDLPADQPGVTLQTVKWPTPPA